MQAVIITIGSELTDGRIVDTNAAWLAREVERRGARVAYALTAPDSITEIGHVIRFALGQKPDLIIIAGGLGPTEDDLTAGAIARELGISLELNPEAAAAVVRAASLASGLELKPHQAKQATLPAGSDVLTPVGTAPGFILESGGVPIAVLPGVPLELMKMWEEARESPRIGPLLTGARRRLTLCLYGAGEPEVGAVVEEIMGEFPAGLKKRLDVSICSRHREIAVDVTYPQEADEQANRLIAAVHGRLSDYVYSDGESIAEVTGRELKGRGKTLATGESCTGGMLGAEITSVSGSSQYYLGGVIAYHNDVKKQLLRIPQDILDSAGAVSEPVAQRLALGIRGLTGADFGIGITGVAGPTGGTPEKPVGLVYICVSSEPGDLVQGFNFPGGREDVRRASVLASLHMLRSKIAADELPTPSS